MQVIYKNGLDCIDLLREQISAERSLKELAADSFNCDVQNSYAEIFRSLNLIRDLILQANENFERLGDDKERVIWSFVSDDGRICEGIKWKNMNFYLLRLWRVYLVARFGVCCFISSWGFKCYIFTLQKKFLKK